ncbi:hypothetical protein Goari_010113, partial [Gossypium aridum]|nr:hypothetical protein [Gossypium aridum]
LGEGCSYSGSGKGKSHEDSTARVRFFAIYDGNLGDIISSYLQKHVFFDMLKEEEFWVDPFSAISKAFEKTDKIIFSQSSYLAHGGQAIQMTAYHDPTLNEATLRIEVDSSQICQ